jgi:hypothetical protein
VVRQRHRECDATLSASSAGSENELVARHRKRPLVRGRGALSAARRGAARARARYGSGDVAGVLEAGAVAPEAEPRRRRAPSRCARRPFDRRPLNLFHDDDSVPTLRGRRESPGSRRRGGGFSVLLSYHTGSHTTPFAW